MFIGFYVCFDVFLIKRSGLPELEMKGDNMEMYCVHKLTRDGGNLTMPETRQGLATHQELLILMPDDKLHLHFQGPFAIEKQINPVIFKLYL